jgi:hypothetical protein
MKFELVCHAGANLPSIDSVSVEVERRPGNLLLLDYAVAGDIRDIAMPILMAQERADELWRKTCFEVFLRKPGADAYVECNFSPSSRWAAYAFSGYRVGRQDLADVSIQRMDLQVGEGFLDMKIIVALPGFLPLDCAWDAGFSAVIKRRDGELTYWALRHPGEAPDFHHSDCFAAHLPSPAVA